MKLLKAQVKMNLAVELLNLQLPPSKIKKKIRIQLIFKSKKDKKNREERKEKLLKKRNKKLNRTDKEEKI